MDFHVGPWRVQPQLNTIANGNRESRLSPKAMDVLVYLAQKSGQVVSKEELFRDLWSGVAVTDDALTRCIGEIRRAVNEDSHNPGFVETVPKRGYRVLPAVRWTAGIEVSERRARPQTRRLFVSAAMLATAAVLTILRPWSRLTAPAVGRIAVLPLVNLTGDPSQEYFADAITEELITELVHHGLSVVSRTSVMRYKSANESARQIAGELHVGAILEGAVMRSGSKIRITAQLIDASTDLHRWSGTFESDLSDVLHLRAQIAQSVASELKVALNTGAGPRAAARRKIVPESYEAYLRGLYFFRQADYEKAADYFEESSAGDPGDALAAAMLYEADAMMSFNKDLPVSVRALNAMHAALKLDSTLAEARTDLGDLKFWWEWNWSAGEEEFRRATQLDPYSIHAAVHYSTCLNALGRFDAALNECRCAFRLDPVSLQVNTTVLLALRNAHRWHEAFDEYQKMVELYPNRAPILALGGVVFTGLGKEAEAVAAFLASDRLRADTPSQIASLERAARSGGLRGYWRERLSQLQTRAAHERVPPLDFARIYLAVGDKDSAMSFVEAAYREHAPRAAWLRSLSDWDPLRSDPRFQAIIERMHFPD